MYALEQENIADYHSSRSIRVGHRGEGGTGTGGTFNIERACCFWYSLYVVYFYTH